MSVASPVHFTPDTHRIGSWVSPGFDLGAVARERQSSHLLKMATSTLVTRFGSWRDTHCSGRICSEWVSSVIADRRRDSL
jgi:hypothetical protein